MKGLNSKKSAELKMAQAEASVNEGVSKFDLGDYSGCIEECNKAEAINPDVDDLFLYRGRAFFELGKYIEAYRDLEIFYHRFGWLDTAQYYHGLVCVKLGFFESAIEDLDRYLNDFDYDCTAHYYHGLANMGLGEYQLALQDFNNAIERSQDDFAEAYNQRSIVNTHLGNSSSADEDFVTAMKQKSRFGIV